MRERFPLFSPKNLRFVSLEEIHFSVSTVIKFRRLPAYHMPPRAKNAYVQYTTPWLLKENSIYVTQTMASFQPYLEG